MFTISVQFCFCFVFSCFSSSPPPFSFRCMIKCVLKYKIINGLEYFRRVLCAVQCGDGCAGVVKLHSNVSMTGRFYSILFFVFILVSVLSFVDMYVFVGERPASKNIKSVLRNVDCNCMLISRRISDTLVRSDPVTNCIIKSSNSKPMFTFCRLFHSIYIFCFCLNTAIWLLCLCFDKNGVFGGFFSVEKYFYKTFSRN